MALGTPVAGTTAYSASGGTSVAPGYPSGIAAGDALILIVGQKPGTANGGTVTTPSGWTLLAELTAAGGYGTTLGADTGNTNLRMYSKDTVTGAETGTLSVTLGTNGVSWASIVRVPSGGGTLSYGEADGSRTTAPTAGTPFSITTTNGASPTNFQTGDVALWAMCIPTDVTTPAQFSAQDITATGAVFGTPVELGEPDSQTGNDIGGYIAWDNVDSGTSTTAPVITVTASGTVTNVRGPVVLVRIREAQALALDAQPGSETITGADATLVYSRRLALDATAGSLALTGQDATLTYTPAAVNIDLDAQPGALTLTGQAAQTTVARAVNAAAGSYAATGQSATLAATRTLAANAGAAAITGQAATLQAGRTLSATAGSFTLSGQDAAGTQTRALSAAAGSFAATGSAAGLVRTAVLPAEAGALTITGQPADLAVFAPSTAYELDAQPAALSITGAAAAVGRGITLDAQPGAATATGQAAGLTRTAALGASAGALTVTGQDATLQYTVAGRELDAAAGVFVLQGVAADAVAARTMAAMAGAFGGTGYADGAYVDPAWAFGTDARLKVDRLLAAEAGAIILAGQAATLAQGYAPHQDVDVDHRWVAAALRRNEAPDAMDRTWVQAAAARADLAVALDRSWVERKKTRTHHA